MGKVALPEMKKYGYHDGLSTAAWRPADTWEYLSLPAPDSFCMRLCPKISRQAVCRRDYTWDSFALFYILTVVVMCRINPELAPGAASYPLRKKVRSLSGLLPMLILFLAVIGGMFSGIFSANEAAAAGAFIGFLFMIIKRKLTFKSLFYCLEETIKTTAMIFLILFGAYVFGYFLTATQLPMTIADFVAVLGVSKYVVIAIIVLVYIILGCVMDAFSMVLITVPIFLPIVTSLGFDSIWFGVLVVMVIEQGLMTPPVGLNVYIIAGVAKDIPMGVIFRGVLPFVLAILIAIVVVIAFPQISLYLPNILYSL
jgi:tripartite ATP-independent transporter DctM subunit